MTPEPAVTIGTLRTSAGEVNLKIPKLRRQTRYRRRESSAEEALIEMYLAGISVRRVEDTGLKVHYSGYLYKN